MCGVEGRDAPDPSPEAHGDPHGRKCWDRPDGRQMTDLSPRLRVSAFKAVVPGAGLSALKHVEGIMHRFCYASLHECEETYVSHKTCGCGQRLGCRIIFTSGSPRVQYGSDQLLS